MPLISSDSWIIIKLPSNNYKLITLTKDSIISLGKFGSFNSNHLINQNDQITYQINTTQNNTLTPLKITEESSFDITPNNLANNQFLNDQTLNQKLSQSEIEQLKKDSNDGLLESKDMIKSIVDNNQSFNQKTNFSKVKYLKRKAQKFSKSFTPILPSVRTLCDYYSQKFPFKIKEIRIDTLSQMMTFGNVHAYSKLLVVDEMHGLLLASCLERMQGMGSILCISDSGPTKHSIPQYLNLSKSKMDIVKYFSWDRLTSKPDETLDLEVLGKDNSENGIKRMERTISRVENIKAIREEFNKGGYDALLLAADYDPVEMLKTLNSSLSGSRPVVIYSQYKEHLLGAYNYMRHSNRFINCQLTESYLREYQTPSSKGGLHPHMMTSGSGGYLLSAITVVPCDDITPMAKKKKRTD